MKNSQKPLEQFAQSAKSDKNLCFLYSAQNGKSFLAKKPIAMYSGKDPAKFKEFCAKHSDKLLIGYLAYDLAYSLHKIKPKAKNDLNLPQIYFLAFENWSEFAETIKEKIPKDHSIYQSKNFTPIISKKQYNQAYRKIQKHLQKGDIYQINLTHRLEAKSNIPARKLFLKVIENNPVDFLAYLEGDNFEILSASPERFIKIENDRIETCPIKGTRPRGKTAKEDKKLSKELLNSEKEAAELNMITDLLRNDLGKICKIGSVEVKGNRLLQKCPTVWHTYSKVVGELATTPIDALLSMLPGGSITGCPKKRAIEIIDELEATQRGVYTGVIGYIHPKNILDFNIAIRTIIKKKEKLYLQVGGGIVIDSKNKDEYQETLDKARSFMEILKQ